MNRHVLVALFQDSLHQVLDDKVFRLLVLLAIFLIAPTFLVGFRPEGIQLLFGWREYTYDELFSAFGGRAPAIEDLHVQVLRSLQELIVQGLAGTVGLLFCIAATAFFVPRMLEKGAADTLFSKPVGRFTLLVARYAAGVLFVACLSFLLVLGMHCGFLLVSGHSDPAFLWSALTLTWVFALVHSVSVAVAVFTRSSVAAILCTMLFFVFTGCVHQNWIQVEHGRAIEAERGARGESEEDPGGGRFASLLAILDGMHWVLPKTTDADYVVASLRRSTSGSDPTFADANGLLSLEVDPAGFEPPGTARADLGAGPVAWTARNAEGAVTARLELARRSRATDSKGRQRLQSPSSAAFDLARDLEKDGGATEKPVRGSAPSSDSLQFAWVRWRERGDHGDLDRRQGFTGLESQMYEVRASFQPEFGSVEDRERVLRQFVQALRVERKSAENQNWNEWYARTFGWSAPARHNALVSIGTSLLFALALLLLARWRLVRIDF